MTCPDEIADILCEILEQAILRIRAAGWEKNLSRCAIEADHVHNLPSLLIHYSPDRLKYYWEAERSSFLKQSSPDEALGYIPLWNRLAEFVEPASQPTENVSI